jgi:hypothetical protein
MEPPAKLVEQGYYWILRKDGVPEVCRWDGNNFNSTELRGSLVELREVEKYQRIQTPEDFRVEALD